MFFPENLNYCCVIHIYFFLWRDVWIKQEDKKFFRGIAGLKGHITYVYDTTAKHRAKEKSFPDLLLFFQSSLRVNL
jgi:hypothetical protein